MYTSPSQLASQRRLSQEDKRRLAADLAKNISTAELARIYGVSRRAIQQFAAKQRGDERSRAETKVFSVRLAVDELHALDVLAGRLGVTRASCAKIALRRASGFFDPDEALVEAAKELMREVKRVGTNLNQLVYHANRRALVIGRGEISEEDLVSIVAMRDELAEVSSTVGRIIVTKARRRKVMIEHLLQSVDK